MHGARRRITHSLDDAQLGVVPGVIAKILLQLRLLQPLLEQVILVQHNDDLNICKGRRGVNLGQ